MDIQNPVVFNFDRAFLTAVTEQLHRPAIPAIVSVQKPVSKSTVSIIARATASTDGVLTHRATSATCCSRFSTVQNPDRRQVCNPDVG
jgi:hypothetical protein